MKKDTAAVDAAPEQLNEDESFEELKGSHIDKVISLETELKMLQDQNMNPRDIFLQHCIQFASSNFEQMSLSIEVYKIKKQDIDDRVFFRDSQQDQGQEDEEDEVYERNQSQNVKPSNASRLQKKQTALKNAIRDQEMETFEDDYDILDIKIFPEVVLINGKQQLIVKTWELIEKRKSNQQQTLQTKNHPFHLKTLRIYDHHNQIRAEILTEQVDTNIQSKHFYDTSILQFNDCIFYFKRIYGELEESSFNSQKRGSLSSRGGKSENGDNSSASDTFTNSYLQLFKYDLIQFKEIMIDGYQLVEYNDDDRTFNIIFSRNFDKEGQINMSKYKDEDEFLTDQYFLAQQYIRDDEEESFAIFCMNNFDEPLFHESPEDQLYDSSTTKLIYYFQHRDVMIEQSHKILFVMISAIQHMHLIHDLSDCTSEDIQIYKLEKMFDRFQNPQLFIHNMQLNYLTEDNKWTQLDQQYFIDQRNQVHLMYPNFLQKSTKYKHIDLIKSISSLDWQDQRQYKKIISLDYTQHQDNMVKRTTFIQPIKSLRKILNFDDINSDQIFTFCKDPLDQVLYITQPDVNQIYMILMRDHNCEECYEPDVTELKQSIISEMNDNILDIFQNFNSDGRMRRSKKSLTRMVKMENHCQGRFVEFDQKQLDQDTQDQDNIEIDIDTQRIMITRKNDLDAPPNDNYFDLRNQDLNSNVPGAYYVFVEDYRGYKNKILLFEAEFQLVEELQTKIIQRNDSYYLFILSALSYVDGEKKKTYIFIRKTCQEVQNLITDTIHRNNQKQNVFKQLVEADDQIQVVCKGAVLRTMKFVEIHKYQIERETSEINIAFEKLVDINTELNFIAMIYQEKYNMDINKLLIYDIDKTQFTKTVDINPNLKTMKYLYIDDQGYNCYKICRSAEMTDYSKYKNYDIIQEQKFQVFSIYIETLGIIQIQEYIVQQMRKPAKLDNDQNYNILLTGQKQIFFSNKSIQQTNWNYLKNSMIIPFIDEKLVQQGCQFIIQHDRERSTVLNLIDQITNNLYTYESDIVKIGSKRFELHKEDYEDYLIVTSCKIHDDVIEKNLLDQQEAFKILKVMQEILLSMRKPDLEYVLMNSFDSLLKKDFFTPQEILYGKSLCDICLSDPNKIKNGIEILQKQETNYEETNIKKSIIDELISGDKSRKKSFIDVDFYPKQMMVNFDFNLNTTIYRGLKMKSMQSIKYLLDYLFEEVNSIDYYKLIMLDLHELMSSEINSRFFNFFEESQEEKRSNDRTKFCNMEVPYSNTEIEQFSEYSMQFMAIKQFSKIHDIEEEICDTIKARMKRQKEEKDKNPSRNINGGMEYPIEHSFVDLNWLVIGEKMRSIKDLQKLKVMRFDHLFYADMILMQYDEMQVFAQKTIQKIIDYQFAVSRKFMKVQFWFYILFYMIPYGFTLVTNDHHQKFLLLRFCIIPQVILMSIKLIQLRVQGCNFLTGWNIIDVTQIICFQVLFQLLSKEEDYENKQQYFKIDPFVMIWLILLSFLKSVHLLIVYEEFGFFIKMITQSLYDLRPFIIAYIFFTNFFVIIYAVMDVWIDEELLTKGTPESLGYYGMLFLAVWRNSIGKLGFPNYTKMVEDHQDSSFFLYANIFIIWLIYFIQILFMLVIGLNFMIAIIESTFSSVNDDKMSYLYRNKAEMNLESFEILQYFSCFNTCEEYRAIIFSTFVDEAEDRQIVHGREEEVEDLLIRVEQQLQTNFEVLKDQKIYRDKLETVIQNQLRIDKRINQEFEVFQQTFEEFRSTVVSKVTKLFRPRRFNVI